MRDKYALFESREQDAFFKNHYSFSEASKILTNLKKNEHPRIMKHTKIGLKQGLEHFLLEKKAETVYLAAGDFCYDDSTKISIEAALKICDGGLKNINAFSIDVCESYRTYVYNESMDRFAKKFKPKK